MIANNSLTLSFNSLTNEREKEGKLCYYIDTYHTFSKSWLTNVVLVQQPSLNTGTLGVT